MLDEYIRGEVASLFRAGYFAAAIAASDWTAAVARQLHCGRDIF
jgi:hypothetical protein